jgi:ribosomal protein S18 acetylase RimI-like enzyme
MSGTDFVVREATEDDAEAVADFIRAAWGEAEPGAAGWAGATDKVIQELTDRAHLRDRVAGPGRRTFLATESNRVVGFAANRRLDTEEVELVGLMVLKDHWGQRIGSRLVDAALRAAREDGFTKVTVRTESDNTRANAFYQKRGFQPGETTKVQVEDVWIEVAELNLKL